VIGVLGFEAPPQKCWNLEVESLARIHNICKLSKNQRKERIE
jgi:hypothetical protein